MKKSVFPTSRMPDESHLNGSLLGHGDARWPAGKVKLKTELNDAEGHKFLKVITKSNQCKQCLRVGTNKVSQGWRRTVMLAVSVMMRSHGGSPADVMWINRWMTAGKKERKNGVNPTDCPPLSERDFIFSLKAEVVPCVTLQSVGTWPELGGWRAVICTEQTLVCLKHQTWEQALTAKVSNANPIHRAAHSSCAAVHLDHKCNFTSADFNVL